MMAKGNPNPAQKITPEKRAGMKPRGLGRKKMLLEALWDVNGMTEKDYLVRVIETSFQEPTLMKFVAERLYPVEKAVMPTYKVESAKDKEFIDQIKEIADSMINGKIPPDAAKAMSEVLERSANTELQDLAEKLEKMLEQLKEQQE